MLSFPFVSGSSQDFIVFSLCHCCFCKAALMPLMSIVNTLYKGIVLAVDVQNGPHNTEKKKKTLQKYR